ncbi:MAG: mechanosensitive ion channel [Gammaproteobacteria bacterium]|nr:mechanosensitive ion channel [Gammaproteobacteria bacterium]
MARFAFCSSGSYSRAFVLLVLLIAGTASAEGEQSKEVKADNVQPAIKLENSVDSLAILQQSIATKREQLREINEELKQKTDPTEKLEAEQKITRLSNEISSLQKSFEHIALGGINQSVLADQPEQKINWKDELEQISRPIVSTLKELTAKPRQMDALRRDIERYEKQLEEIDKALETLRLFRERGMPQEVSERIGRMISDWEIRKQDALRGLEISRFKLEGLKVEGATWQATAWEAVSGFILGRGLTLFLAIIVGVTIWLVLKWGLELYWRWLYRIRKDVGMTRAPLVIYAYRLFTAIVIVLAVLMVFYVRGDVLLITLALLALAGVALSLRQTLPRYAAELRLLLGIGPVREDERLVYDGVPFKVISLSVFSILRNPQLDGVLRLPLHSMSDFTSRHAGEEPWFPCQPGDYILMADGSFGRVLQQTIEMVEILLRDARVQVRTGDFLDQNIRNLSRDGFGVACTFGVDYQHQAICLDEIPSLLREAIFTRFEQAELRGDIQDLVVEFKEAGASSLDYQIYMILKGRAAKAFFKAQRLIQQACVETCNREGWVIPFTQITVHSAQASGEAGSLDKSSANAVVSHADGHVSGPQ